MATTKLTGETIGSTVQDNDIVLVDFWATWCPPCRMFGPIFESASEKHEGIVFGKVDTDAEQELAAELQITSIPTLMAFRDGILVYNQPGALPLLAGAATHGGAHHAEHRSASARAAPASQI